MGAIVTKKGRILSCCCIFARIFLEMAILTEAHHANVRFKTMYPQRRKSDKIGAGMPQAAAYGDAGAIWEQF